RLILDSIRRHDLENSLLYVRNPRQIKGLAAQFRLSWTAVMKNIILGIVGSCLVANAAWAEGDDPSIWHLSGFGTAGVSHSNNSDADFVSNVTEAHGAGETNATSAAVDSKLGVQISATPNDNVVAVLQILTQQRWDGSWTPTVEWANVSYQLTPDLNVRLGRTVWPMFVRSQTVNVGYSNFAVRASGELAAEMPNTHNDGVDATYNFKTGAAQNALTLFGGKSKIHYGDYLPNTIFDVKKIVGVSDMVELYGWTLHAAAMHMQYTYTAPGVAPSPVKLPIYSVGAVYDSDGWYTQGDYQLALDPYYGRMKSLAVLGGYHFGAISPYVSYSSFDQSTFGPGVPAPLQSPIQHDRILGVRYDIKTGVDVKLQLDNIKTGDVAGSFPISLVFPNNGDRYPQFLAHPSANVISVVVDFVF
ncbi:MAG: hypothetical protein ACHP7O_08465, partial [Burkholderiales bacterium]